MWRGAGEGSPGPHPRMKLRGIWSRPTPKGEVEGDLVQAHTQGGSWGGSGREGGACSGATDAVRILLECILVEYVLRFCSTFRGVNVNSNFFFCLISGKSP